MTDKSLKPENHYKTSDLALASTISLWFPIDFIDKSDRTKAKFSFKREDGFDELVERYWRGDLKVEPKLYFNQLRMIKTRIYEESDHGK